MRAIYFLLALLSTTSQAGVISGIHGLYKVYSGAKEARERRAAEQDKYESETPVFCGSESDAPGSNVPMGGLANVWIRYNKKVPYLSRAGEGAECLPAGFDAKGNYLGVLCSEEIKPTEKLEDYISAMTPSQCKLPKNQRFYFALRSDAADATSREKNAEPKELPKEKSKTRQINSEVIYAPANCAYQLRKDMKPHVCYVGKSGDLETVMFDITDKLDELIDDEISKQVWDGLKKGLDPFARFGTSLKKTVMPGKPIRASKLVPEDDERGED